MYYAIHPHDFKTFNTQKIRDNFLLDKIFIEDSFTHYYTHYDRLIIGGVAPASQVVALPNLPELKSKFFLERREIGIINVGARAKVSAGGTSYELDFMEALYLPKDLTEVQFHAATNGRALFYYNSAPAHHAYQPKKISLNDAETVTLGALETANHRTIRKLIVNSVVKTCQLQMGLTELKTGSVWNTMPPHTHDRRMEAYFYFGIPTQQRVCHFLGEPEETRHIWVANHDVVLSPPWSIHSGAGTSNYSFIWGMAGENLDYSDMDTIQIENLR